MRYAIMGFACVLREPLAGAIIARAKLAITVKLCPF
jgi:hypothetical protein